MPYTWILPYGDIVSNDKNNMYYRGQLIKEAYYRGQCVWRKGSKPKPDEGYDVCFWDWDGTLVRHYSAWSFIEKYFDLFNSGQTEWPFQCHPEWTASRIFHDRRSLLAYSYGGANIMWDPDEVVLEPNGYNWTFAGAMLFVLRYGMCDIGLMYSTPCTLQWIQTDMDNATAYFKWGGSYTIDYGDGSEPKTVTAANVFYPSPAEHVYEKQGLYLVKITGNHYGGAQENETFTYVNTPASMTAWRRTSIDMTTHLNIMSFGQTSAIQHYASMYYQNSNAHTFAIYAGPECTLNRFALEHTWLGALGFSDTTGLDSETVQIAETVFGDFQHVNIPKGWPTLWKDTNTTVTYLRGNLYGGDTESTKEYYSVFARLGNKLKHFCLPEGFSGNLFINNATALERIILSPYSKFVGYIDDIGPALKTLLIPIWVESSNPEVLHLRKGSEISSDLQVLVPYAINGYNATLDNNYNNWYSGEAWMKSLFASQTNEAWLVDYVKAAEYYSYYWQWG